MSETTPEGSGEASTGTPSGSVKDKTGQRFGRLVVVRYIGTKVRGTARDRLANWLCRCDCGTEIEVDSNHLKRKGARGCGCVPGVKDKTGKRFNMLLVIKYLGTERIKGTKVAVWLCQCDCGNTIKLDTTRLLKRVSCGCLPTYKDKVGQRFGKLTVTKYLGTKIQNNGKLIANWLCKCDCGNEIEVITSGLTEGRACGCGRRNRRQAPFRMRQGYYPGLAARNSILKQYRWSAKNRGLAFELTEDEFDLLIAADCHYCGRSRSKIREVSRAGGAFVFNGIDRKDNGLGYVTENVVTCCIICNRAKGVTPYGVFIAYLEQIVAYRSKPVPSGPKRRAKIPPPWNQGALFSSREAA